MSAIERKPTTRIKQREEALRELQGARIGRKTMHAKAYETMVKCEEDINKAIQKAKDIQKGIRLSSISRERKIEMLDELIAVLKK